MKMSSQKLGVDAVKALSAMAAMAFMACAGVVQAADTAAAKPAMELPADPARTSCVWLDAKPADRKGEVPADMPAAFAELTTHNADEVRYDDRLLVLRKSGYAWQTATFRYKLPDGTRAGTYEVWTHFTLGGVADQDFTLSAGASPDALERRAAFRQSNGVSWQMAWRKGDAKLELRAEDRWMEIVVAGMATEQRQFTGFLLAAETEESRVRDAVGAMRSSNAGRRFYVLEGENPADIMPVLRYFSGHREALTNTVDVQLLRDQEARDLAARAGAPVPALVAATRGVLRDTLALPATPEAVARFIEAGRPAAIILECGEKGANSPASEDGQPIFYGQVTATDATQVQSSPQARNLLKGGYTHTTGKLRYELTQKIEPGQYDVWTFFTVGGIGWQGFTVRAGADTNLMQTRVSFGQQNVASWAMTWLKGAPLTLYPQDRFIEIAVGGMHTDQTILDDFVLVQREPLPAGMTAESGVRRAEVEGLKAPSPKWRIWIMEGDKAADSDPFYERLAGLPDTVRTTCNTSVFLGAEAVELARDLGVDRRPALALMDDRYMLRGVLSAPSKAAQVKAFIASATASGPAPGPFPVRPRVAADVSQPLANGVPAAWLTVSGWAGPAGLSLWGLDAEARTRPNPGDPCAVSQFDVGLQRNWAANAASDKGLVVIEPKSGDYTWGLSVAYAHLYLDVEKDVDGTLRLAHTGIGTQGWLDGQPLAFGKDATPPADFAQLQTFQSRAGETAVGVTDQGGKIEVRLGQSVAPQTAPLSLKAGRHRLLIKLVTQQPGGQTLAFAARFADAEGKSPAGLRARVSDPDCALAIQADARRLTSRVTVDAPANLPHQGQPLRLRYDLRLVGETKLPIMPFDARLVLKITDYGGKEVLRREVTRQFPGVVELDLGKAPERGYYAVQPTLYTPDGKLIMTCVPDGFSVIGGTASQLARREQKKMAVTYYFMGAGEGATYKTAFPWMTRTGIYRNIGSNPEWPLELAEAAKADGLILTMDFWDMHNGYTQEFRDKLAKAAAPYTRWYKSFNEADSKWTPAQLVARTKGEYEAVKAARPDAFYVGCSWILPGSTWFSDYLKLGLDQYVDGWDVHAYPQRPPVLGGGLGNSPNEADWGISTAYQRIGKTNTKPFWMGECGARASHGWDARRWQADTVAKMVACICSRKDFQYVGFLWPWADAHTGTHAGPNPGANDISTAHMPGEAAYYTASALIDGFDYTRLDMGADIQAARFGETIMLWSTGAERELKLPLDGKGPWVVVDVVGRVRDVAVGEDGSAPVRLTGSPVYVLTRETYERLTAW